MGQRLDNFESDSRYMYMQSCIYMYNCVHVHVYELQVKYSICTVHNYVHKFTLVSTSVHSPSCTLVSVELLNILELGLRVFAFLDIDRVQRRVCLVGEA